jgi:Lrp/AsnC family transcriptional regulator for asnA, asnC and gidA
MAELAVRLADEGAGQFLAHVSDLSETDRAIVLLLQEDGRRSFANIAREVGIAERTVRHRVRDLLASGVIQITAVTDPVALGYHASALIGLTTDPAVPASEIALSLVEVEAVDYVVVAAGRYALFAEVICRDMTALQQIIEEQIGPMPGVRSVEPFPYLSLHYQLARFDAARRKETSEAGVRPRTLNDTDRRIVRALSDDGRVPFQAIADQLGISETQVRNRVHEMTAAGVMNVIAIVNPMSFAYTTMAWVAVNVAPGHKVVDVAGALSHLPHITYVAICTGRVDIFAELACVSPEELRRVLDDDVRQLPGIGAIEVSRYLALHYKRLTPYRD